MKDVDLVSRRQHPYSSLYLTSLCLIATKRFVSYVRSRHPEKSGTERAALLIASSAFKCMERPLKGHNDIQAMKDILISQYMFLEEHITILSDHPDAGDANVPTKANIMNKIKDLIALNAKYNVFVYAGHSLQRKEKLGKKGEGVEDDGFEECLMPSDVLDGMGADEEFADSKNLISDKELKESLVKPLRNGTFLLGIFDCCHSGTILNLRHIKCNETDGVIGKGRAFAKKAIDRLEPMIMSMFFHKDEKKDAPEPAPELADVIPIARGGSMPIGHGQITKAETYSSDIIGSAEFRLRRSIRKILRKTRCNHCSGFCPNRISLFKQGQVVCISACKDAESVFETKQGGAVITAIVKFLKEQPAPTYRMLMTEVKKACKESRREAKNHIISSMRISHPRNPSVMNRYELSRFHKGCSCLKGKEQIAEILSGSKTNAQLSSRYPLNTDNVIPVFANHVVLRRSEKLPRA